MGGERTVHGPVQDHRAGKEIGGDVCLLGSRTASNSDTRFMPFYSFQSRMDLQYGAWVNNYGGT
ncbi:MAG: hypothetical protein IIT98_01635, partial [Kiritimatiellae bacterium]|nr:hypothetical protein [Kiritimatiellia bacterium]